MSKIKMVKEFFSEILEIVVLPVGAFLLMAAVMVGITACGKKEESYKPGLPTTAIITPDVSITANSNCRVDDAKSERGNSTTVVWCPDTVWILYGNKR